jgi:hypothetical protein
MGDWQGGIPPQGRQPSPLERFGVPDPEFHVHRDHRAEAQLPWILDAVDRYGRARFIADRRAGNRLCRRLRDLLPAGYQAQIEEPAPDADSPSGRYRWDRRQTRLTISRIGGPKRSPRFEDPQQRALDSRGWPAPQEENSPPE